MPKPFNPKVSIVIPVYNGSNYLKEAIDSALAQTYKNIEVIVVNDGSNDKGKTEKICKSYGNKIRYFKKENGGVSSALNYGIEKMEGEYFSWLSHDDIYYPEKVEKQINVLSRLKDRSTVIYSDYAVVDENLNEIYREELSKMFSLKDLNKPLFSLLMGYINSLTLLIHKDNFKKYGVFDEQLLTTQDYDLWFRILRNADIKYIPSVLTKTRIHNKQSSNVLKSIHEIEGVFLWKNMFSVLTLEEKVRLSGSVTRFYEDFYNHFKKLEINSELQSNLYIELLQAYKKNYFRELKDISAESALKKIAEEFQCHNFSKLKKLLSNLKHKPGSNPRIVFWSDNWNSQGGVNRVIGVISSQLVSRFDVYIGSWRGSERKKKFKVPKGVKLLELDDSVIDIKDLPKFMSLMNVELFICSQNFDKKYLSLYETLRNLQIKTIAWDHSHYFLVYYFKWLLEVAKIKNDKLRNSDLIVCINSVSTAIYLALNYRAVMVRDPLPIKRFFGEESDISKHPKDIIAVGRFDDYQKRLDILLEVFAGVLKKLPKTKLYIVGSYDLEKPIKIGATISFSEYIRKLGIKKDNIIFTGHVENIEDYYKKASVHVITSEREGFGIVLIEAANFGLPSVAFQENGAEDVIIDGENGYLVPRNNLEEMTERIIDLLENDERLVSFSKNIHKVVKQYEPEVIAEDWFKLCQLLTEKTPYDIENYLMTKNSKIKLSQKENQIIQMYEDTLMDLLEDLENYDKELGRCRGELIKEKQNLVNLETSKSWRLTYPFRKISRFIYLIKTQGLIVTTKNIFLKLKHKIRNKTDA